MKSLDELKRLSGGTNTNGSPLLFHFTYGQLNKLVDIVREDAIHATKEKAAKMCEELHKQAHPLGMIYPKDCAAAIRGMK